MSATLNISIPSTEGNILNTAYSEANSISFQGSECVNALNNVAYFNALYNTLKLFEGYSETAYSDSEGIKTIGIGFNLEQSEASYIIETKLGLNYSSVLAGTQSLSSQQVQNLFDITMRGFDEAGHTFVGKADILLNRLSIGDLTTHSFSGNELIALQSLAFTNSNLVGGNLMSAIGQNNSDYILQEIIEESNSDTSIGIANRRLMEGALYNGEINNARLTWREFVELQTAHPNVTVSGAPIYSHPTERFEDTFTGSESFAGNTYDGSGFAPNDKSYFGTTGDDVINGGIGNEILFGGDGSDTVHGGYGDDYYQNLLLDRSDYIEGGAGNDYLYADAGFDTIRTLIAANDNQVIEVSREPKVSKAAA